MQLKPDRKAALLIYRIVLKKFYRLNIDSITYQIYKIFSIKTAQNTFSAKKLLEKSIMRVFDLCIHTTQPVLN